MHDVDLLAEAQRQFTICNACRYCEGYCAVFPAMERRLDATSGDLEYLAHLCHDCRACYQACMYAEPHEFAVNIPQLLSTARVQSFKRHAWPGAFATAFRRPAAALALVALVALAAMLAWLGARGDLPLLARAVRGAGSFYRIVPYLGMLFGASVLTLWAIAAWSRAVNRYLGELRAAGRLTGSASMLAAMRDGFALTYLRGGGGGCFYPDDDAPSTARRRLHIALVVGILLAFVATCIAAVFQELLRLAPPYPWWSAPVIAGTLGGIAIVIGSSGLLALKRTSTTHLASPGARALDLAFLLAVDAVALTGIALLLARETSVMGPLLLVHLSLVAALFATAPYGKLVHALYRLAALAAYHREEAEETPTAPRPPPARPRGATG